MDNFHKGFPRKALCICCGKYRKIFYGRVIQTVEYREKEVQYEEIQPYCTKCGWPVDAKGSWDENLRRIKEAYKNQNSSL